MISVHAVRPGDSLRTKLLLSLAAAMSVTVLGPAPSSSAMARLGAPPAATTLAAGSSSTVYIDRAGRVRGWGANGHHELGAEGSHPTPAVVPGLPEDVRALSLAAWDSSVAVVADDGLVYGIGQNTGSQLTGASEQDIETLTPFTGLPASATASRVALGPGVAVVTTTDGRVFGTGANDDHQLGPGAARTELTEIPGIPADVKALSAAVGDHHVAVLGDDANVYGAGRNDVGQIGGAEGDRDTLTQLPPVPNNAGAYAVVASGDHTSMLGGSGRLWSVGRNDNGQFGTDQIAVDGFTRELVGDQSGLSVGSVAVAGGTTYGISNTKLVAVGRNPVGACGTAGPDLLPVFTSLKSGDGTSGNFLSVAAGPEHLVVSDQDEVLHGCSRGGTGFGDDTDRDYLAMLPGQVLTSTRWPIVDWGQPIVGHTVSARLQEWSPTLAGTSELQWLRDGADIPGQTGPHYEISNADIGTKLSVRETRVVPGLVTGVVTSPSVTVLQEFEPVSPPTMTGTYRVGGELRLGQPGVWSPEPTVRTYRWMQSGGYITGGDGTSFTVPPAYRGTQLDLEETVSAPGYATTTRIVRSPLIAAGLITGTGPTVTGTRKVGGVLTAVAGGMTPSDATSTFQWTRSGTVLSGQNTLRHVVARSEGGTELRLVQRASLWGYDPRVVSSSAQRIAAYNATRPTISGTMRPGRTLTASAGLWYAEKHQYSFRWYRSGRAISGATARRYTLRKTDKGRTITVRVTARRTGWPSVVRSSDGRKVL
jgi:hypothetical protein